MANPTDTGTKDSVVAPTSIQTLRDQRERGKDVQFPRGAQDYRRTMAVKQDPGAMQAITSPREAYEALPPDRKSLMHLGFDNPYTNFEKREKGDLGTKKIIAITTNDAEASKQVAEEMIRLGLALPLDAPIIPGPDSKSHTTLYVIPKTDNSHAIALICEKLSIPAVIKVSGYNKGAIRFGNQVFPLDPALLAHTPSGEIEGVKLQAAHWNHDQIKDHSPSETVPPQILGEPAGLDAYTRACSMQLAQQTNRAENASAEESSYLILDIKSLLQDQENDKLCIRNVLSRLASLSVSPDFFVTMDQQGNLIIINRAQRSGSAIARLASDIEKFTKGKSNILICKGRFKIEDESFDIENYPNAKTMTDWQNQGQIIRRTYFTEDTARTLATSRDATTTTFEVDALPGSKLLALRDLKRNAKLHIGGPDRLIGYENEFEQMSLSTESGSKIKLTIVNGGAGSGKSRLANEVLQNHPEALVHSVDASGENIPGSALAEMATTILDAFEKRLTDERKRLLFAYLSILRNYAKKPEEERLREAQKSPKGLVQLYTRGLQLMGESCGSFILVIDDVHHIDRHSEQYMMDMLENFLADDEHHTDDDSEQHGGNKLGSLPAETSSKAMILRRPEETYHSVAQNNLAGNINRKFNKRNEERGLILNRTNYVETVNLNDPETGKPKLNVQDIAYEYAFYSLPENIRINFATGKARNLGNWPKELATKCRTPFDLTSILNSLLEDPEKSLIIGDDSISIKPEKIKELSTIKDGDLHTYHQNRMRRLPTDAKALLQCVAILGSKVSIQNLQNIAKTVLQIDSKEISAAIVALGKGGYIIQHEDGGFEIQHSNYRDIAISSLNKKRKRQLIAALYEQLHEDPNIHNDTKFALLSEVADDIPINQDRETFWSHYVARARQAMSNAEDERAYGRGYSIAMTILNNLEADDSKSISQFLELLKINPLFDLPENPPIKKMIYEALFAIAKNGLNLGNFAKTFEAIEILAFLNTEDSMTEAYLIGFRAAQIQIDVKKMQQYYDKLITHHDLKPEDKLSMEIRLSFKKEDFSECARLFEEHDNDIQSMRTTDSQAYDELMRLKQRISLEQTRFDLENNQNIDGDVALDPGLLDRSKTQEFLAIQTELQKLNELRKSDPDKFNPLQELYLQDQMSEIAAFLGDYNDACTAFSEVWRIAQQMQIPTEAVRAAKSKGDVKVMQAIAQIQYPTNEAQGKAEAIPNGTIHRKYIIEAMRAYTENGLAVLKTIPARNSFQLIMRGQRMRAVSILVRSYQNEIESYKTFGDLETSSAEIKAALLPHLSSALKDFHYISSSPIWGKGFVTEGMAGYYSYYATSSMGHILQCIEDLGITEEELGVAIPSILDDGNFTAFNPESLEAGLKFAATRKDNVGETDQGKLPGFAKIISLGDKQASRAKKVDATEHFHRLKATHQKIVSRRQAA